MSDQESSIDEQGQVVTLAVDFAETLRVLFAAGNLEDTLATVVHLATTTIDACELAAIFLVEADEITDSAFTDPIAAEIEELQIRFGEGPGIEAIAIGLSSYSDELGEDSRWPHFGTEAAAKGVRSLLALPVVGQGTLGALDLYAYYPQAFGVIDRAKGLLLSVVAGIAAAASRAHSDEESRADNLQAALVTRELIGQAQGILIERERITADQAFAILRQASQYLNVKLREVAQSLVDTGERPDTGPRGSA